MMNKIIFVLFVYFMLGSTAFAQDCGCEGKPLPDVLSVVNGVKITVKDLDPETQARITDLKSQVVEARKLELHLQINSKLLEAEAKKRKLSTSKLLEEEVIKKASEPQQQHELAKKFAERLRSAAELKILVDTPTPPATPADRQRVFATLNNQPITSANIEDSLQPAIFSVQQQMYELRRRDLDRKINDVLLAQEAHKLQVTTRALLDTEVNSKVPAGTDAKAEKLKLQLAFATRLRKAAAIEDFLTPPEVPKRASK